MARASVVLPLHGAGPRWPLAQRHRSQAARFDNPAIHC
jgi:hypothetical protein